MHESSSGSPGPGIPRAPLHGHPGRPPAKFTSGVLAGALGVLMVEHSPLLPGVSRIMITTLRIHNFRTFHRLTVEGLTRVSLLVGANNAGKTSVLEAAELVLGGTGPSILERSTSSRGEVVRTQTESGSTHRYIGVNHLFRGH